uniref:Biotin carboxyl carrier protein of acetyl-CoA carboxylase n=1 Tax=Ceramothamnion japonicum TaxID=218448 RepID=A0A1C9CD63_CERJP|nr:acetyl-CoA carboxylase biotin carboxyl carrier protein [Ceramium japonicum]AOM66284.1 acetyl-CoA carboxylase biotin carboxyl carrier protein [Ceramium japonicum]
MQFLIKDLKIFLKSIQKNHINQIYIKSHQLEITINRKHGSINQIKKRNSINTLQKLHDTININHKITNNNKHQLKTKSLININRDNHESQIYSTIISPMVGTFYQSPAPNEKPFIKKGDFVEKKQTVCIIEAMKLMNEIEAEVTGEIVEILVSDGDIVDCGQALMRVKI